MSLRQCLKLGKTGLRPLFSNQIRRNVSSTDAEATKEFKSLVEKQKIFQREDLVEEVYIKGGAFDVIMFRLVLFGTFAGVCLAGRSFYVLAFHT